jgi:hypothetical protein
MKFKLRFGSFFILKIVMIITFSWLTFHSIDAPTIYDWQYDYILYIILILAITAQCYRLIYSALTGKPVLIVNEAFIYDFDGDIKYYWRDIETISERDSYLFINLYQPTEYLDKIGNPVQRFKVKFWFKPGKKRSLFTINIDNVAKDSITLLKLLNNYSIGAEN